MCNVKCFIFPQLTTSVSQCSKWADLLFGEKPPLEGALRGRAHDAKGRRDKKGSHENVTFSCCVNNLTEGGDKAQFTPTDLNAFNDR